jgi:NADPH:quinone reductase-like Zn-dependent oxidoreductase
MRAFILASFDAPAGLRDDLPAPQPGDTDLLVRVQASSVNPVDGAIASGALREMMEHEFPVVLGRDYAGVVEEVGSGVRRYAVGDEVYGYVPHANPTVHDGSWAELLVVPEDSHVGASPAGVELPEAGAAALAGITALACVDALEISEGNIVVVVGATGGVGHLAVQLLAHAGAIVIAPAMPEDEVFLRGVGVSELIERGGDVAAAVRERRPGGVDGLIDLVSYSPDDFNANAAVLKDGGRASTPLSAAGQGPGRTNVMAVASPANLERLATLLGPGTIKVYIQGSYPLDRAAEAMNALGTTHTEGKLGIQVS